MSRHRNVVRDHHDREPGRVQLVEQVHERGRVPRVQVPGRLVAQQQARPVDQRPRNRDPLALPARQRGGQRVEPVAQPDRVERVDRGADPGAARGLVVHLRQQHVLQRRPVRQQMEGLEDEPDPAAAQRGPVPVAQPARVQAVQQVAARGRRVEQAEQVQQRGLARAGRPGHRHVVTRLDDQVGRAQRRHRRRAGVGAGQAAQFDHRRTHLCLPLAFGPAHLPIPFTVPPSLVARPSLLSPGDTAPLRLAHPLTATRSPAARAPAVTGVTWT